MDIEALRQCIDSLFFRLHSLQDLCLPFNVSLDDILNSHQTPHDVLSVLIEQEYRNYEPSNKHASPVLTGPEIHDLVVFAPKFDFGEGVRSLPSLLGICTELEQPQLLTAFCGQLIVLCQPHFPRPDSRKRSTFFQQQRPGSPIRPKTNINLQLTVSMGPYDSHCETNHVLFLSNGYKDDHMRPSPSELVPI